MFIRKTTPNVCGDRVRLTLVAGPINEDNFFEWEAMITGPEGTCFEGGVFPAKLTFPPDYPLAPPKMQFTCEMYHPNIYPDGRVCISILHAPGNDLRIIVAVVQIFHLLHTEAVDVL